MNNNDLQGIDFTDELLRNVELFDRVLNEVGEPPMFENENFRVFPGPLVHERGLVLEASRFRANTLPLMIWFQNGELRIDIDNIPEMFDWAREDVEEDENSVLELIRNLLTGYVLIDDKGAGKFIQMFDSNGGFVGCYSRNYSFHMFTGRFLFNANDYRKLYLPLFSKS